jgi:hypothetical protein
VSQLNLMSIASMDRLKKYASGLKEFSAVQHGQEFGKQSMSCSLKQLVIWRKQVRREVMRK